MSNGKIITREEFAKLDLEDKKIVFTNGCFDILHAGHVQYLEQAKKLGDILVVGLNSDASVRRLKGENRPINKQEDRALVLAALEFVDYIIIFEEDTPYELIKIVNPDVLVKGGDWKETDIIGADIVQAKGGTVLSLPLRPGLSTSKIIEEIKKNGERRNY
ncbi:MAG TPA: D-glycero-beta-D-manno-heptose 1-phosphate adenylyltransferase [Candidatus Cloacimonadota bacterium]|nr:D-glycero-beta-D-manno-heptose 1-phosphate adenylyltransferase [Candidatus Cloacimonadota bacterium]HQL14982.1 D-glycero-beta-D-manno-heptose 1-phosphate adenylyltransferase [Candidatus Cloacimonadota bacterium]